MVKMPFTVWRIQDDATVNSKRITWAQGTSLSFGQRSGAILNLQTEEFLQSIEVQKNRFIMTVCCRCMYLWLVSLMYISPLIQVSHHKTDDQYVCNLVMDQALFDDLKAFHNVRKNLPGNYFFCDAAGKQLRSNYLPSIANIVFGGPIKEMRKAHYYLVSRLLA